ncbi:MAG TPA: response regulator transcription factor, partial [Steroidobacteraceae bacterium]|nr:response regulator transcription factor [Steroidobacteraceae bacterium]
DDHEVVRQGLRELIARTDDLEVVAEAADGAEAERLARTVGADLLVLDIAMPGVRGTKVLEALRADGVKIPVLLFSMYPASQYMDYARRAGAQGFVDKSESSADLLHAIRDIVAGEDAFPAHTDPRDRSIPGEPFATLSRRESEVMQGLLKGESLQQIADGLGVGVKSVATYRRRILDKVGVDSNAELAALAARLGII